MRSSSLAAPARPSPRSQGVLTMHPQVACPQCRTPLRSAQPIPVGMKLKCPRCAALFVAPTPAAAAPPVAPPPAQPSPAPPRSKAKTLALVAGGGLLLVGLAVVLVIVCLDAG